MKENNKSFVTLIVVLAVLVIGYVLWISYANKKVREVVEASIERIENRLESKGKNEVTVSYDDVKVHGMSLRPRASVYKLHVKIEDKVRKREMHVMLPEVVYIPKTFDMHSYKLEVLDSVTVISNRAGVQQESTLIDFSRAPSVDVNQSKDTIAYSLYVPQNITLTDAEEMGEEAAEKTDITFEGEPQVEWSETRDGLSLDQKAVFPATVVTQNGEVIAAIDAVSATSIHSKPAEGKISYDTLVKVENLTFADEDLQVLNPISVVNDITYTSDIVTQGSSQDVPMHIEIKNVAWMSGLMSLFAKGELHEVPGENMPYGNIALRVDDMDRFLDYTAEQRPNTAEFMGKVRETMEKISGAPIAEGGEVNITITREQGGRLQIGSLSLEEALAMVLKMAMQVPDFSAPQEPAVSEEASEGEAQEEAVTPEEAAQMTEEDPAVMQSDEINVSTTPDEEVDTDETTTTGEPTADKTEEEQGDAEVMQQPTKPTTDVEVEIRTNTDDVNVEVLETSDTTESAKNSDAQEAGTAAEQDDAAPQEDSETDEVPVQ